MGYDGRMFSQLPPSMTSVIGDCLRVMKICERHGMGSEWKFITDNIYLCKELCYYSEKEIVTYLHNIKYLIGECEKYNIGICIMTQAVNFVNREVKVVTINSKHKIFHGQVTNEKLMSMSKEDIDEVLIGIVIEDSLL
jgi:hypothetical protein